MNGETEIEWASSENVNPLTEQVGADTSSSAEFRDSPGKMLLRFSVARSELMDAYRFVRHDHAAQVAIHVATEEMTLLTDIGPVRWQRRIPLLQPCSVPPGVVRRLETRVELFSDLLCSDHVTQFEHAVFTEPRRDGGEMGNGGIGLWRIRVGVYDVKWSITDYGGEPAREDAVAGGIRLPSPLEAAKAIRLLNLGAAKDDAPPIEIADTSAWTSSSQGVRVISSEKLAGINLCVPSAYGAEVSRALAQMNQADTWWCREGSEQIFTDKNGSLVLPVANPGQDVAAALAQESLASMSVAASAFRLAVARVSSQTTPKAAKIGMGLQDANSSTLEFGAAVSAGQALAWLDVQTSDIVPTEALSADDVVLAGGMLRRVACLPEAERIEINVRRNSVLFTENAGDVTVKTVVARYRSS